MPNFRGKGLEAVAPVVNLLREIGKHYDKSSAQISIRWLIKNPLVLPIPDAKNARQAAANAEALNFHLKPHEVETLNQSTLSWRK